MLMARKKVGWAIEESLIQKSTEEVNAIPKLTLATWWETAARVFMATDPKVRAAAFKQAMKDEIDKAVDEHVGRAGRSSAPRMTGTLEPQPSKSRSK